MEFNKHLLSILSLIKNLNISPSDRFLHSDNEKKIIFQIDNNPLVEINEESISLLGNHDIEKRILPEKPSSHHTSFDRSNLDNFFSDLGVKTTLFNHVGISYVCSNFDVELSKLQDVIKGSIYKLYEEDSGDPNQRWFFIGNRDEWQYPLFELVVTKSDQPIVNQLIPHFQIDLDTSFSMSELEELTAKYLKDNFFNWKLDIPNYGVVLAMGELANINDTKIYLGLGTNLRDTYRQRTVLLKEV